MLYWLDHVVTLSSYSCAFREEVWYLFLNLVPSQVRFDHRLKWTPWWSCIRHQHGLFYIIYNYSCIKLLTYQFIFGLQSDVDSSITEIIDPLTLSHKFNSWSLFRIKTIQIVSQLQINWIIFHWPIVIVSGLLVFQASNLVVSLFQFLDQQENSIIQLMTLRLFSLKIDFHLLEFKD